MKKTGSGNKGRVILVLNLGSTSTKVAVYREDRAIVDHTAHHTRHKIAQCRGLAGQLPMREAAVLDVIRKAGIAPEELDAVVTRGGLLGPCPAGIYRLGPRMLKIARTNRYGIHPCNLGILLADGLAKAHKIPAFTVNPPTVDELCPEARLSGIPQITRRPIWHALNQKAVAHKVAKRLGKPYGKLNLIVAHLGGGISVAAHQRGLAIDVNNALDGDGPFGTERSGGLPAADLVGLTERMPTEKVLRLITGRGGVVAYLGTNDMQTVERRIQEGDAEARAVIDAMAWQVAKAIGACATVLKGKVDAVVLTGSLARWKYLVARIRSRTRFIAPVKVIPGEMEMVALAKAGLQALTHSACVRDFRPLA